jgi:voltage-gated potassium channel
MDEPFRWKALRARLDAGRGRIDAFVARHQLAWDLTMAGIALVYIGIGALQDRPLGAVDDHFLALAEAAITIAFVAEFALRLYAAPSRRAYLLGHWIDLLALLPAIRWLRVARLASVLRMTRILRLGVLVRLLAQLNRVGDDIRWIAARNGVHVILSLAVGLSFVGGSLVWELEHRVNPTFAHFGDAIWWAFATMTTVGYGNGPVTLAGRIVAAVIMVAGIACYGVITATVTAVFLRDRASERATRTDELVALLEDIRARLVRLEQASAGQAPSAAADGALVATRGDDTIPG